MRKNQDWYMYVVECIDGTLYTGITTNLSRRLNEHNHGRRGAKYTRSRRPVKYLFTMACSSRSEAASEESKFKKLSRRQKLKAIQGDDF